VGKLPEKGVSLREKARRAAKVTVLPRSSYAILSSEWGEINAHLLNPPRWMRRRDISKVGQRTLSTDSAQRAFGQAIHGSRSINITDLLQSCG
jgi:hypothetical protein